MIEAAPTVFIIDDDLSVCKGLARLLKSMGLNAEVFSGGEEFLQRELPSPWGCMVIDACMPGLNGIELQKKLIRRGDALPCILITGNGDISLVNQAKEAGVVDVLAKPFDDLQFLHAIERAIRRGFASPIPH